jgi:L,D-transpeptidase catalytic domain
MRERRAQRLQALALGLLTVLLVACGSGATIRDPGMTSSPTFAVTGPDPAPRSEPYRRIRGDEVAAAKSGRFRVYASPRPGGGHRPSRAVNDWGQPLWLPVIGERVVAGHPWFHVRLPVRPNGSTGWLRAGTVLMSTVPDRIVVRLRRHTLTRYDGGEEIERYRVAVGKASTPTATGRFFVWARVGYDDTDGPYGNFALGLSGFSDVITDWPGGGRMAIHGTSDPNLAGRDVSNGCIRVFNPLMATLIEVPIGTTVIIRP